MNRLDMPLLAAIRPRVSLRIYVVRAIKTFLSLVVFGCLLWTGTMDVASDVKAPLFAMISAVSLLLALRCGSSTFGRTLRFSCYVLAAGAAYIASWAALDSVGAPLEASLAAIVLYMVVFFGIVFVPGDD